MHTDSVLCLNSQGFHRMVYHQWGSDDNERVLVCVHGLARNSRDFDELAKSLARDYRVICPDIVGRGSSDWLPTGSPYGLPQYLNDMTTLLARLNVEQVDWLGTSMGGIIGICLAAQPNSPIRSLVLNDIGSFIPANALQRISSYLGHKEFSTLAEVEQYMKSHYLALKNLNELQWQHLVRQGVRPLESGGYALHYDPAIAQATAAMADQDVDLMPFWRAIQCPQALIWGEASDVLTADTVTQMQALNSDMALLGLPGICHAPSLMEADQIRWVQHWLRHHQ
ncbi:MAG: alpha/beta fold hydrolase [Pontibacterium sp.]